MEVVAGSTLVCSTTVKNLRADDVEKAVLNHLDEILSKSGYLNKIEINMKNFLMITNEDMKKEKELKENTLHILEMEIDSALKYQFSVDSKSQTAQLMTEKLEKMAEQRKLLKNSLEAVKDRLYASGDARAARLNLEDNLEKFKRGWKKATPIVQKRFLRRMLDCLIFSTEGLKTFYHIDILEESHNQQKNNKMAEGKHPLAIAFLGINQILRRALASSSFLIENASAFVDGAGDTTISPLLHLIDFIDISSFFKETLFEKAAKFYETGLSLAQVAQTLLIPKTTLHDTLVAGGVALRPSTHGMKKSDIGAPNYGHIRIDGKIVKDPKEQKLIRLMLSYWQSGMSFNAIAKKFNSQKFKPRTAKKWDNGTIRKIILRTNLEQGKTK